MYNSDLENKEGSSTMSARSPIMSTTTKDHVGPREEGGNPMHDVPYGVILKSQIVELVPGGP